MGKTPITLCTCAFGIKPGQEELFLPRFEAAQEAGFDGFELSMFHGDREKLVKAVHASGAKVVSVHGVANFRSINPEPEVRKEELQRDVNYLEPFSEFAPCPVVEHYLDRFLDPAPGKRFHESMGILLEKVEKMGFRFCMENVPFKPLEYERYSPVAEVAEFARSFGPGRMFVTIDVNHLNLHEDPVASLAPVADVVRHVHISDNHGEHEEHLLPGEGTIDFPPILRALREGGYHGPCNWEFDFPEGTELNAEAFRMAHERIRKLVEQSEC